MATAHAPQPIRLADYRPPPYRVHEVDLVFDLDAAATRVTSTLRMQRAPDAPADMPLVLDGEDLRLVSVALDNHDLAPDAYRLEDGRLVIPSVPAGFTLCTTVEIAPEKNTKLEGLYISDGTFCTQCEAEGFRRITFFPDRPDAMAVYTVTLRADAESCPVLLANGNPVSRREIGGGRHEAVWHDPFAKPSYLFALVAGRLAHVRDSFTTASGREVELGMYVAPGSEARCAYAMDALKRSMRWDEERFGREYDLDVFNIVAVDFFNMGAMENKGLNIFNAKYVLADPETATDADYAFIESVVAHEYFHNWTGNRITCRDWFQLSLKEGLTVWRDQQFSADMRSPPVQRIKTVRQLRNRQFLEDSGPLAHPVRPDSYIEINNFYTATVYEKGAEVIGMMATLLGRAGFRAGMDLYFQRHDGQAVTCEDFATAMHDAGGADLGQFQLWYRQAGTPHIGVSGQHDAQSRTYTLTATQTCPPTPGQPDKHPMHIPFAVGLIGPDGRDLPLRLEGEPETGDATTRVLHLTDATQRWRFVDVDVPPLPSLNRDFAAPVIVDYPYSRRDRAFLMAHDSDLFSRWDAGQQYATDLILDMAATAARGEVPSGDGDYVRSLKTGLVSAGDDALAAQVLTLPSLEYLADRTDVVDVDALFTARQCLRAEIAEGLRDQLLKIIEGARAEGPYSPDAASAGRRAIGNAALTLIAALADRPGEEALLRLIVDRFETADNMTDRMAALVAPNDLDVPPRRAALDAFESRYSGQPFVLDKWLSLEAMSTLPGTLQRIRDLTAHPFFSLRNPNRVRALVGVFANANLPQFHAADGGGYGFLSDIVVALDPINPQTAARLAGPLGRWRRFDAGRQRLMRGALERILAAPALSPDVYEIASKSLDAQR